MAGSYMVEKSKGQTEVEGSGGRLLPAVQGHSLGTRYISFMAEKSSVATLSLLRNQQTYHWKIETSKKTFQGSLWFRIDRYSVCILLLYNKLWCINFSRIKSFKIIYLSKSGVQQRQTFMSRSIKTIIKFTVIFTEFLYY